MTAAPQFDDQLWLTVPSCEGRHYILGNPHTFPGRIMAWCPHKQRSFFFSSAGILDASALARAWIAGFLAGNEPSPPRDESGDVNFGSEAYAHWQRKTEQFRTTGSWPDDASTNSPNSIPMGPHPFVVDGGQWGFFTGGASSERETESPHELKAIHVSGLRTQVQFVRVASTSVLNGNRTDHVIVSAYAPFRAEEQPDLVERLSSVCGSSALSLIVDDHAGWARAVSFATVAPEAVAAVVAYSKASGGWDESNPILVEVGTLAFSVATEFQEGAWRLVVRQKRREA